MDIQVKDVQTDDDLVIVDFVDGYRAVFEPYTHGWGYQVEGLRRFTLKYQRDVICVYNSRLYRSGPQDDEHKIKSLKAGWTQQQVGAYWQAARKHLHHEYFEKSDKVRDERLWYPWIVVTTHGGFDCERMCEGKATFVGDEK